MSFKNERGQTLVESLGALVFLITVFSFIFYIFLMGIEKIRSLDTVYHLARIQNVQKNNARMTVQTPLAILQCFGRLGVPQNRAAGVSLLSVNEVSFTFLSNFSTLIIHPRQSIMRMVQPNFDYLTKSYPGAAEDLGGTSLLAKLEEEKGILVALAEIP